VPAQTRPTGPHHANNGLPQILDEVVLIPTPRPSMGGAPPADGAAPSFLAIAW